MGSRTAPAACGASAHALPAPPHLQKHTNIHVTMGTQRMATTEIPGSNWFTLGVCVLSCYCIAQTQTKKAQCERALSLSEVGNSTLYQLEMSGVCGN